MFRHPHIERNKSVDVNKMRFEIGGAKSCQKYSCFSAGEKTKPRIELKQNPIEEIKNMKRQMSESHDTRGLKDNRQRLKIESQPLSVDVDSFSISYNSCDQSAQHLRRRSSLELRGVAQAITAAKLHLNNGMEIVNEDNSNDKDHPMICDNDRTPYPRSGLDTTLPPQLERKQSGASSLVDGGVETATQNIVTDAIEALLFDESHTRETYNRHKKELSVSSLPGVVPISKQLFSENESSYSASNNTQSKNDRPRGTKKGKTNERGTKQQSLSSSSSLVIRTTTDSLENASKNNRDDIPPSSFSNNSYLRVVIPSDFDGLRQQQESTYGSTVVSPARMEAAAALVSQSRNRND